MIRSKGPRIFVVCGILALLGVCSTHTVVSASAQSNPTPIEQSDDRPAVLVVTAHPDDEGLFAATIYRLAVELGCRVEVALITDGAGGYRFSTLAERIYGLELTNPEVAKEYLPAIRKQELMRGGRLVGIRNYHFLDQTDSGYTQDPDSILADVWDGEYVFERLTTIMREGAFDFVFTHLPLPTAHGHHKSASILAIRAASTMEGSRPVVLGSWIANKDDAAPLAYAPLDRYPISATTAAEAGWEFDRTREIGLDGRLNYKIPVNWLIAEHKSQGTMQMLVNAGDLERFWLYKENPADAGERTDALFALINTFESTFD